MADRQGCLSHDMSSLADALRDSGPSPAHAAVVTRETEEFRLLWIRRHRGIVGREIQATQLGFGKLRTKARGAIAHGNPLLFQLTKIQRSSEHLRIQIGFLEARMAVCQVEQQRWSVATVLPARGPDHRAEAEIGAVQIENVEKIT